MMKLQATSPPSNVENDISFIYVHCVKRSQNKFPNLTSHLESRMFLGENKEDATVPGASLYRPSMYCLGQFF